MDRQKEFKDKTINITKENKMIANNISKMNVEKFFKQIEKDDQLINDIIDKVDKEISEDLDELILMLKDSIIDEVKIFSCVLDAGQISAEYQAGV